MKNLKRILIATFTIFISTSFAQTKNVLFLGNSYTGVNNLPLLTYNLALSLGDTINYDALEMQPAEGFSLNRPAGICVSPI